MLLRVLCACFAVAFLNGCGKTADISKSQYESALQVNLTDDMKDVQLSIGLGELQLNGLTEERETLLVTKSGEFELGTATKADGIGSEIVMVPRETVGIPRGEKIQTIKVKYRVYQGTDEDKELIFEGEKEFPGS